MEAALASSETTGVPVSAAVVALDATTLAADIAAGITQDSTGAGLALGLEADINATTVDNAGLAQKVLSLETTEVADVTTDAEDAVVQVDEKLAAADQTAGGAADAVAGGTDGSAGLWTSI